VPVRLAILCGIVLTAGYRSAPQRATPREDPIAQRAAEITRDLGSADIRTVAWAAYDAGRYHLTDAAPSLVRLLAPAPAPLDRERWALVDVVLDALIQLDARVPAAEIVKFAEPRPVQTLVLLTAATGREGVLVDQLAMTKGYRWYAAANILLRDKSPGLARHLFGTVRLDLTIVVSEREPGAGALGDSSSVGVGDGIGVNPKDFPPHAQYRFEGAAWSGFVVLAAGPHPIYYSRTVSTTLQYPTSFPEIGGPTDDDRLDYLRALGSDTMMGVPLRAESRAWARWTTAEAFLRRVEELRRDLERRYRYLQTIVMRATGVPLDAAAPPRIDIRVEDQRTDRSVPLPEINR